MRAFTPLQTPRLAIDYGRKGQEEPLPSRRVSGRGGANAAVWGGPVGSGLLAPPLRLLVITLEALAIQQR
jgi:hypothetical protein